MGKLLSLSREFNTSKAKFLQRKSGKTAYSIIMYLIGIIMLAPFIFMISVSFKTQADAFVDPLKLIPGYLYLDNYKKILSHQYYFIWYWNSIICVAGTVLMRVILVTTAAYAFAKLRFRGKEIIFIFLMSAMMVTPDTTIVARYFIYKYMNLIDTLWVMILPHSFSIFFLFLLRQFFRVIPDELSEAALIDGCSHFKIYYRIILPLCKPAITTLVLFSFIWTWNNFVDPFVFINTLKKQLVTVGLQFFQDEAGTDYALKMAGASFTVIPCVILFIISQKHFVEGIARSGIKG